MEEIKTISGSMIWKYEHKNDKYILKRFLNNKTYEKELAILKKLSSNETISKNKHLFCLHESDLTKELNKKPGSAGYKYIVFPFHNMDLHTYITRANGTVLDLKNFDRQLIKALTILHEAGFVHNDIKPQNIYVSLPTGKNKNPRFVIGDFGTTTSYDSRIINKTPVLIGTPLYMSPLSIKQIIHPMNDFWSYACTLINILTLHCVKFNEYKPIGGNGSPSEQDDEYEDDFEDESPCDGKKKTYLHLFESNDVNTLLFKISILPNQLYEVLGILKTQSSQTIREFASQITPMIVSKFKNLKYNQLSEPCHHLLECIDATKNRRIEGLDEWIYSFDDPLVQRLMKKAFRIYLWFSDNDKNV